MAYVTQSPDTNEAADRALFAMLRAAGSHKRLQLARAHTCSAIRRARRRIASRHPEWSERESALHWVSLAYGEETAQRLRAELQKRESAVREAQA